ncbi:MAG: DUF4835 family protein, partial [Ferruginibacter sp.]|nr:DUF4835 family protein [Ferruginibacter sp.]
MHRIKFLLLFLVVSSTSIGQELNARVTVVTTRVSNNVNRNTFLTLQTALNNFLNNRKWSSETYAPNERIDCNFLLNLESTSETNVYKASLTIQAARPVFNTNYLSPIINYKDDDLTFKYIEFQQLDFNENRVTGTDALASNLTAVFAYYAYLIIGFDSDSFSPKGGEVYFQKAQNIVNNAPDGRNISGWKAFDGIRNRYWLVENMSNSRFAIMHDIYYNYYRLVMDKLYDDEKGARAELLNVLNLLDNFNTENPNKMITQFFFQGKATELVKVFSKASPPDKA